MSIEKGPDRNRQDIVRFAIMEAELALEDDNTEKAIERLKNGLRYLPDHPELSFRLAHLLYHHEEEYQEATLMLQKAVIQRPDAGNYWALLGEVLFDRVEEGEAIFHFEARYALEKATALLPDDPHPAWLLAEVLARTEGGEAALQAHQQTAARLPDHVPTWVRLLVLSQQLGQDEMASTAKARLTELQPHHPLLSPG